MADIKIKDYEFERSREANEENESVIWAENNGWEVRKMEYVRRRGCADRFFFGYGAIVPIEFKRPGKEPDIHQAKDHKKLAAVGVKVHVCRSLAEVQAVLRKHMR